MKQSAKNKRFPLEKGNKEAKRIHQQQSNKKAGVKKSIRGDQHTVKANVKSNRKRRGQYCVLLDDNHTIRGIIPDSVNFVAECYYKTVTFSAEDFARRLSSFGHPSEDKDEALGDINNSDSDPDTGTASLSSATSRSSSVCSQSSNCQVILNHQTKM